MERLGRIAGAAWLAGAGLLLAGCVGTATPVGPVASGPAAKVEQATKGKPKMDKALQEVLASIRRPTNWVELMQNVKIIWDHDLLLRDEFYDEEVLKRVFAANTAKSRARDNAEYRRLFDIDNFDAWMPKVSAEGRQLYSGLSVLVELRSVPDRNRIATLAMRVGAQNPLNRERVFEIFGNGFVERFDPTFMLHYDPRILDASVGRPLERIVQADGFRKVLKLDFALRPWPVIIAIHIDRTGDADAE